MPMEGKRFLAGRYDVHRATQTIEPDQRADAAPFDNGLPLPRSMSGTSSILMTVFSVISQTPSRPIEMPFCASPANGAACARLTVSLTG